MENQWRKITQLAQQLGDLLIEHNCNMACAESCTGGGIAFAMTENPGSSAYFLQSWVTYSNQAKQQALGVSEATLKAHGAVSLPVVEEMAVGSHQQSGAQLSVTTSGIAGPGGATETKPVGLVCFGFCCRGDVLSEQKVFAGDRQQVRLQAIEYALTRSYQLIKVSATQ